VASHRHVFGVFFWFLVPIGPAGAVLYRIAEYLSRAWSDPLTEHSMPFSRFAQQAFFVIDWVPARLSSMGFAIVGNFEDAIYAWRHYSRQWPNSNDGVLLAAGSGALGARLAGPLAEQNSLDALAAGDAGVLPVGEDCTPRTLQSAVGLVWRAVVLWMILLLMLTIAVWIG
jgi:adenosylcobinamide-phosphate synthase